MVDMYKDLLPIGSIVRIKGGERNLMICGRIMARTNSDEIYDYVGCLYPEGIVDPSNLYFFNREGIDECVYRGYEGQEELDFRHNILDTLDELEVVDGKIVQKEK